ncbi:MAG TPA: exonuclease domain-containing protein, partial [Planococcus sp. (in: firmicutes)]|nr:exonuclease domain-containing protein [Planococcus sp. (in: firmicutes)]
MTNQQDSKMRFQLLLQHLELTEDVHMSFFEEAELTRMTVHKKERTWRFIIKTKEILPLDLFLLLKERLHTTFASIAGIQLTIETGVERTEEELVVAYWRYAVEELADMAPPLKDRLLSQSPDWQGNKILLNCCHEHEMMALKSKYSDKLAAVYQQFGFPRIAVDFQLSEENQEEAHLAFMEERKLEEEEMANKALSDMKKRETHRKENGTSSGPFQMGTAIKPDEKIFEIQSIVDEERRVTIEGFVFDVEVRELRSGRSLLTVKMTDYTDSILVKMFSRDKEDAELMANVKKGMWLKARGSIQMDTFVRDLVMMAQDMVEINPVLRKDTAEKKRVELHLHTKMSQMDAVSSVDSLVGQAAKWGHSAIAVTDHAGVQSFPDAYAASKKHGIKAIFGLEANLVDDGVPIAFEERHVLLEEETIVVFDLETTGLSAVYDTIIELAAVKIKGGQIIDKFESFTNPHHPLSATTIDLTGITDDMVKDAPEVEEVIRDYHEWAGDHIMVAHNASFDMGFLYVAYKKFGIDKKHATIDTLELARMLHPELKNHRLNTLAKKFGIELTQHHRAIYDTEATAYLLTHLMKEAHEKGILYHDQLNDYVGSGDS